MCELLGLSFNQKITPSLSLRGFRHRGDNNPHGWGLVWYPDKSTSIIKEPLKAGTSKLSEFLQEYRVVSSSIFIAHVRWGNVGGTSNSNTHPFTRELFGYDYAFAHNGTLRGDYNTSLQFEFYQPIGDTDSEHAFCHLMGCFRIREIKKWSIEGSTERFEWLHAKLTEVNAFGKFNCIFSDGQYLFCYHDHNGYNGLTYVRRESPFDSVRLIDEDFEINLIEEKDPAQRGYIIATSPLTNEDWTPFAHGELKVFREGRMVYSSASASELAQLSSKLKSRTKLSSLQTEKTKDSPTEPKKKSSTDVEELQSQIEEARNSYKPESIRYLLIAEAPPNSIDRFFYYPDVKTADYLFLGVMGVLFPDRKRKYISSGRTESMKKDLLRDFQEKGFFLLDLLDFPINLYSESLENAVPSLVDKLKKSVDANTPIILIKANVYDLAFQPLVSNGFKNTVSLRIPFPGQGWQTVFGIKFSEALEIAGYE